MMLKKRSRAVEQDQREGKLMSDSAPSPHFSPDAPAQKTFFRVPGLFVSLNPKSTSDRDSSVWSPTSPLDYKPLSNLGSPCVGSPGSPVPDGHPRSWDSKRVGLGLVDSFSDEATMPSGRVRRFPESKKPLLETQMRINIPSLKNHLDVFPDSASIAAAVSSPKTCGFSLRTPIGRSSLKLDCQKLMPESDGAREEAGKFGNTLFSSEPFTQSVHYDSRITSEDCLISSAAKPNAKSKFTGDGRKSSWEVKCSEDSPISPRSDFLNFCHHCEKKLQTGEDIYIYKGEKAFCSSECRGEEILIEEETG